MNKIKSEWNTYMCNVDDKRASIMLNLALINHAPLEGYENLVEVIIAYDEMNEDGFPPRETLAKLYDVEDKIVPVASKVGAIYVGGLLSNGEKSFYFYCNDTDTLCAALNDELTLSSEFKNKILYLEDKEWNTYINFLYPDRYTYVYMMSRSVTIQLEKQGDKLEEVRDIDFWLYFNDESDFIKCKQYFEDNKFKIVSGEEREKDYVVHLVKESEALLDSIFANEKIIIDLEAEHNFYYDGWGCSVCK